ncbi:MAG: hypothetical protein KA765_05630 [Thermoflexales bacterium]|nr:hypothetical protein [Thermoflexales bacterium]
MPIQLSDNGVIVENAVVPFAMFGSLVAGHLHHYGRSMELEGYATELRVLDFPEESLKRFVRRVCTWGGYAGIGGRIIKQNSFFKIQTQFRSAVRILESDLPNVGAALSELNHIRGLGTPSFASKHLRFLQPSLCPILDSIVATRLHYRFRLEGYEQLAQDCLNIADILQRDDIDNPMNRESGKWYAADVEMALFAHLNKLC